VSRAAGGARRALFGEEGRAKARVDNDALVDLVGILEDKLRLVLLNACSSETLAAALVQHVDHAIVDGDPGKLVLVGAR
jgi:hypothetical protein